jgi:hypothetical protein
MCRLGERKIRKEAREKKQGEKPRITGKKN